MAELIEFGVVVIDKPPGPTSHQLSSWVGALLDVSPAAHAGTLDPKVTGCLPILLGTGTRMVQALTLAPKEYVVVLELHGSAPTDFDAIVESFQGPIYQKPPRKSAVKRRLRVRRIESIDILEVTDRKALLRIRCESGTYIRKVCHDLGLALGTGAHMGDLRRTASGPFDDTDLVEEPALVDAVARYEDTDDPTDLRVMIQPAERALSHLPWVTIAPSAADEVIHGAPVFAPGVIDAPDFSKPQLRSRSRSKSPSRGDRDHPLVVCATPDGSAVCLGRFVGEPDQTKGTVVELERVLC